MAILTEISGIDRRRFQLAALNTLGRDRTCTVPLADPLVSRQHAEIRRTADGTYRLLHMGGTHGTYLCGRPVTDAVLADGDEIVVGATRLRFEKRDLHPLPLADVTISTGSPWVPVHRAVALDEPSMFPAADEVGDETDLRSAYERLRVAHELAQDVAGAVGVDDLLERVLARSFQLFAADRCAILVADAAGSLTLRAAARRSGSTAPLSLSRTVLQAVFADRSGVVCADAATDLRFGSARSLASEGIRSIMCAPMINGGEILGVIHLDSQVDAGLFTPADLDLLTMLAAHAALAIRNARLRQRIADQEQRARDQEKVVLVGRLAGGVAHDLNNLVGVILHYAETIADGPAAPDVGRNARAIQSAAERAVPLGRRLLAISRGDVPRPQPVDVNDLISRLRQFLGLHLGIDLALDLAPVPPVLIDPVCMEQVLFNLAMNASDAMPGGGRLQLRTWTETAGSGAPRVHLAVRDEGCGMSPEVQRRLFEPFFTTKPPGKGTGLGLVTVRQVVTDAGGTIEVESAPGAGTTVRLCLPAADAPAAK